MRMSEFRRPWYRRVCPHWWTSVQPDILQGIMFDVASQEACRLCGLQRVRIKAVEPHPGRSKYDVVQRLQQPDYEVVVEEWVGHPTLDEVQSDE